MQLGECPRASALGAGGAAVGVPSALDVWLGECPRRNSRGESARSGPVARRAARPALAAEAFASTAPCGSSARNAGRLALAAEACASTAYSGPVARSAESWHWRRRHLRARAPDLLWSLAPLVARLTSDAIGRGGKQCKVRWCSGCGYAGLTSDAIGRGRQQRKVRVGRREQGGFGAAHCLAARAH